MPPADDRLSRLGRAHARGLRWDAAPATPAGRSRGDESVRLLFQLGPDFEKFSPGALLADTKTGLTLGLGHLSAWKRTALVTDVDWVRRTVELLGWMTPGELRLFGHEELDEAKAWVAA